MATIDNAPKSRQEKGTHLVPIEDSDPEPPFKFDPDDEFYMAKPLCQLLHYRKAAVLCGILEAVLLLCGVVTFFGLHRNATLNSSWLTVVTMIVLLIACTTSSIMIFGIATERPGYLLPQLHFLNIEIVLLLLASAGTIISMSLGIEWTHYIFYPFLSAQKMEQNFGPIWPFNVAIVTFSGAAIGIWMHAIVHGCYDYLLDKAYFQGGDAPLPHIQLSAVNLHRAD